MQYGFGIDVGGTTVKIAYFDESGTLLDKWEIPTVTENAGKQILPDIASAIGTYIKEKDIKKDALIGIGMGVPGAVCPDGTVNRCINLGWGKFNIQQEMEALTGLPVAAGNDATVAALGECWKGGGEDYNSMVFVTLGTGVGGGIVIDGKVLHGVHGAGGEIGHMVINRDETENCGCGKQGCVEQYCSATGIVRQAKQFLTNNDMPSSLRNLEKLTCKDVFEAAAQKDVAAGEILEQVYAYLGEFLANICNVIDPEAVVIGGGVSKAGQQLLDGVQRFFEKHVFHAVFPVQFSLARLGNDAGAYGAFKLILDRKGK